MEEAGWIFLDRKFLDRRAVAVVRPDQGREVQALGRAVELAAARQGRRSESRYRLPQLLRVGVRLASDERPEVSRVDTARGGAAETALQPELRARRLLGIE